MSTHYQVLGVAPSSDVEEIRLAYLSRARQHHPDRLGSQEPALRREAERRMVAINAAWFVLRDADRRRLYDTELARLAGRAAGFASRGPFVDAHQGGPAPSVPDWEGAGTEPVPHYGGRPNPTASLARLFLVVLIAVFVLLSIAFGYAIIRSGSVGL